MRNFSLNLQLAWTHLVPPPALFLFISRAVLALFPTGKVFVPKQKPIETRQEEVTTLDPELEEALTSATDTELCDLAGEPAAKPKKEILSLIGQ